LRIIILLGTLLVAFFPEMNAQKTIEANFIDIPPVIDGMITEGEWAVIDSAIGFTQMEPRGGQPATEKTIAYICYDNENIYVAFICLDPEPDRIVASFQNRDYQTKGDDMVALVLDTYNDQRSAYAFLLNPLSTQTDIRLIDDGKNSDHNYDTEWSAAAIINQDGWVAELAIPFKSINYRADNNTWGINFGRVLRKNSETSYWSGQLSEDLRPSQGGILENIKPPSSTARLSLFPYGTLRYEDSDFTGIHKEIKPDAGVDARIGITPQLTANLTYNPDFATVEGDQEEINLTRYEINFPEKRLFFQEGNDLFSTRIQTFYSRRINDIDYGGKVTGKIGGINLNALSTRTVAQPDQDEPAAVFSAIRLKGDILKSSTAGLTFVDKSCKGGYARSLGADYMVNLGKTVKLTGQFVGSAPGDFKTHSAWFVRAARENNIYHYHVRYSHMGENFRDNVNQTGFVREDDARVIDSDVSYRWWMKNNIIEYLSLSTRNNIFWSQQGILRSWNVTESARLYMQNRFSLEVSYNDEFKLYEKKFYNHRYGGELGYNTDEWASARLGHTRGQNFDRDFTRTTFRARVKPVQKLGLEYRLDIIRFDPDPGDNSTVLNILSANYNFTPDLWLRVFAQNNTATERIYFYGLFGWRFKPPFGAVYLIYTTDNELMLPEEYQLQSQILFLKLTYPILVR